MEVYTETKSVSELYHFSFLTIIPRTIGKSAVNCSGKTHAYTDTHTFAGEIKAKNVDFSF